jgi:hypothetical protein
MAIKIKSKDLGPNRFYITVTTDSWQEDNMFKEWMSKNCSECMCVKREQWGSRGFWEVRGGEMRLQLLIMLRWS